MDQATGAVDKHPQRLQISCFHVFALLSIFSQPTALTMPGPAPKTWRDRLPSTTPHRAAHLVSFVRYIPAVLLRINLLAVCCMAYFGTDEDDYTVPAPVGETIKFPPLAAHIQRTEIALVGSSL